MIGQNKLRREILELIKTGRFPRFSIVVGERGSEKHEVPSYVADVSYMISIIETSVIVLSDNKVGTVRDYIDMAYKQTSTIIVVLPDADSMSAQAVNALLKVTEEPPNHAYFMMLADNESNLLETIKSRAYIFRMDRYTSKDLKDYMFEKYNISHTTLIDVCATPGDVDIVLKNGLDKFEEFYDFTYECISDIIKCSGAKAFTLLDDVRNEVYDINMFFRFVQYHCLLSAKNSKDIDDRANWCFTSTEAGFALQDLSIKGINKKMLLDTFVLNVRRIWR